MILAVYDESMRVCGISVKTAENNAENIFVRCNIGNGKPYYLKAFVWKDLDSINPLCDAYIQNL